MDGKNRNTEAIAPSMVTRTKGILNFRESPNNCPEEAWAIAQAEEAEGRRIAHHASFLTTITKGTGFQPAAIAMAATIGQRTAFVAILDINDVMRTVANMTMTKAKMGEGFFPIRLSTAFPRISPAPEVPKAFDMERIPTTIKEVGEQTERTMSRLGIAFV